MAMLDQLTLATASPKRDMTPTGRFRRRLAEALDLQLEIARADQSGAEFRRTRQKWVKTETGSKELREMPVRLRRWWWRDATGNTYLSLRHGAKVLEIAPGKRAIEIGVIDALPEKLGILREAIYAGELDGCLAAIQTRPLDPKKKKTDGGPRTVSAKS